MLTHQLRTVGGPTNYWIATLGGTGAETAWGIAVDSSGNVYVAGSTASQGAGGDEMLLAKYDNFGTIQWQRVLGSASAEVGYAIAVDSSGNVYVAGYTDGQGLGLKEILIAKYNTSGTIQWQRILGGAGAETAYGIAVDSSGNVYVTGYTSNPSTSNDLFVTKYNTSGTIQWQIVLSSDLSDIGTAIAVDSSGNVYVAGYTDGQGAGSNAALIAKYNTSGTIQWQQILGGTSTDTAYGIAVDSSGNVYVVGSTASQGAGSNDALIAKYNTSGTIQWQRVLGGTTVDIAYGIAVDSSANVYVAGTTASQGAGSLDVLIAKYNTSGTIQWQRVLGGVSGEEGNAIAVDSSGNVYVAGYTVSKGAGSSDFLIAKLPGDGSRTGTYGSFTYAISTLTAATSTLTAATSTLADSTLTLTAATSTLTGATSTLTSTITKL